MKSILSYALAGKKQVVDAHDTGLLINIDNVCTSNMFEDTSIVQAPQNPLPIFRGPAL